MSWQVVRGYGEFPDDLPEPPEADLCEVQCAACYRLFATPVDAPERFCSWGCEQVALASANPESK